VPLIFRTLQDFRAAHPARGRGPEVDYGRPWLTGRFGPAYRAAWLPATGELVAVRLGPESAGGGGVEILAHVPDRGLLEEMLRGWRAACGTFDSMRWLRARIARAHPLKRRHGWALAA
jgi:hypothetical protein